jgi:O-antigen ligase
MIRIKNTLFISTSIILVIALIQHVIINGDPYLVRGTFENPDILGMFLCISLPLVYTEMLGTGKKAKKIWMVFLLLLTCYVLLSGSALASILISIIIMSWLYSKRLLLRSIMGILLIGIIYIIIMPPKNKTAIKDFVLIHEQGSISKNYYRVLNIVRDFDKQVILESEMGGNNLQVLGDKYFLDKLTESLHGSRYKDIEDKKHIKNRYLDMAASINLLFDYPVTGCGLGNYQSYIGKYFIDFPKMNTAEPSQNNTYLIIGSTTGLIGLATLFYLLIGLLKTSYQDFRRYTNLQEKLSCLGILGSLVATMINGFFIYLFSTSLVVPFIFILYLCSGENRRHV